MFTLWFFFPFLCAQFWQGARGGFILFTSKAAELHGEGCWCSVKQQNHTGFYLKVFKARLKLLSLSYKWVFFILIFTMVIPRMSGWVFPILPEDWLEISERNSELLRAELTVNIQLVFMTGLCRCYFFSSLLKKGAYFQLSENDGMWLTSVIIPAMPCASQPCRKGRIGKSCRETRWRPCP